MSLPSQPNPWKITSSEIVHETPWVRINHHTVINPGGSEGVYAVTEFKNLAIGILAVDKDYNIWLVGQFRYPVNEYSWEIPEGGGNMNIDPINSAGRELKEEAGIVAQKYTEFMRLHLSNSATDELAIIYLATGLSFEEADPEESEVLEIKKLHLNEAFNWVMQGKITDAISVAAILKAKWLLDNKQLSV